MAELTAKQEKFVQEWVKGNSKSAAYRTAYNVSKMKDTTIHKKAKELSDKDKIRGRYEELNKTHIDEAIMTRDELLRGYKKAFCVALGVEATESIIKQITEEGEEVLVEHYNIKRINLKAVASLGEKISKLEGWDKTKDDDNGVIQDLADAIRGIK